MQYSTKGIYDSPSESEFNSGCILITDTLSRKNLGFVSAKIKMSY